MQTRMRWVMMMCLAIVWMAFTCVSMSWAGTITGTDPKGDPIQPVGVTISRSVCPPTESGYGSPAGAAMIQVRVGPAQRFGLGHWSQLYGCGGISATMTLDQPDRAEFFLGSDKPHGSGDLYIDPVCEIPQSNHIISWPRVRTLARDPNMPNGFVQRWVGYYNPIPSWPSSLYALAAWASPAHLYHFDWGELRPDPELDNILTEKPYLNVPEPTPDTIFLSRAPQLVESDGAALSDCRGFFLGWQGRGDRLLTRLRPGRFTRPGFTPPAGSPDQSPPVNIRWGNLNPWDEAVMTGVPAFFEPQGADASSGSHVSYSTHDRTLVVATLDPLYEPRRASYSIIGAGFGFPLVVGKLHTIHTDICVWAWETNTCLNKPDGTEIPTSTIPPPADGWLTLSATWFGPLTVEEQGAQTGDATGKEMPHPKGVLSSLKDGDELEHLQQRLTWKLIEPANRPDLLVAEEPVLDDMPFRHVVPFARLNMAEGGTFEVELAVASGDGERLVVDKIRIGPKEPLLVANYDRDEDIDAADQQSVLQHEPLYLWVNDDFDNAVIKKDITLPVITIKTDVPCQYYSRDWVPTGTCNDDEDLPLSVPNWFNNHVDSVRDLIDFFPVWVNIESALTRFPATEYQYILKNAAEEGGSVEALNAVIVPGVNRLHVADYLRKTEVATKELGKARVVKISPDGYVLPEDFLALDADQRVILLEGRMVTDQPLVLEIRRKTDDHATILTEEMPLQILNVEEMFWHKTLRPEPNQYADRLTIKLPDTFFDRKNFVYVHGFKVDEEFMRGSASEMFKRLWQTGYNGKFWYVSWDGQALDTFGAQPIGDWSMLKWTPHFHNARINAFANAKKLADFLETLTPGGPVDMVAHSLGNVLASAAIADYGAPVRNYYALDAAVALEAYGTKTDNGQPDGLPAPMFDHLDAMVSSEKFDGLNSFFLPISYSWKNYAFKRDVEVPGQNTPLHFEDVVYASEWYRLFQDTPTDPRRQLTWRNRLRLDQKGKKTTAYNFFSSTEDVVGVHPDPKGLFTMFVNANVLKGNLKSYVWQIQELLKGVDLIIPNIGGGSASYAGWGFVNYPREFWDVSLFHTSHIGPPIMEHLVYEFVPTRFKEIGVIITTPEFVQQKLQALPEERDAFLNTLKTDPLFRRKPEILFGNDGSAFAGGVVRDYQDKLNYKNDEVANVKIRDWLLSKAIPSRTGSLGSRENPAKEWDGHNFNMSSKEFITDVGAWPDERQKKNKESGKKEPIWWHTDFEDVAYLHVWKLYEQWKILSDPENSQ